MKPILHAACDHIQATLFGPNGEEGAIIYMERWQYMAVRIATRRFKRHQRYAGNPNREWKREREAT